MGTTVFGTTETDYVTLTTFSPFEYASLHGEMGKKWGDKNQIPCRILGRYQGQGWKGSAVKMGVGEQVGRQHYIVQVHGSESREIIDLAHERAPEKWSCTRVDIQLSLPDEDADFRQMTDDLRVATWQRRGPRSAVNYIDGEESEKGVGDTLYIGSRKSDLMSRIYRKRGPDERVYLRLELEFKGKAAQGFFDLYKEVPLDVFVMNYVSSMPQDFVDNYLSKHVSVLEGKAEGIRLEYVKHDVDKFLKTFKWLKDTAIPALYNRIDSVEEAQMSVMLLGKALGIFSEELTRQEEMALALTRKEKKSEAQRRRFMEQMLKEFPDKFQEQVDLIRQVNEDGQMYWLELRGGELDYDVKWWEMT